jgi:hypothetical protein
MTRSGIEVPPTGRKVDYNGMDVIRSATAWSRGRTSTRTRSPCFGSSG